MAEIPTPAAVPPVRVLVVCTGNICRSPVVERLLAAELGAGSGPWEGLALAPGRVQVASAGVGAVVGSAVAPPMAALLSTEGLAADGFVARQLEPEMLRTADLVLTMTRRHRATVVQMAPPAVRRTFTLREAARLCTTVDPAALPSLAASGVAGRLRALIPLAAAGRGTVLAPAPQADDVVDPYGGDDALYRRAFGELLPAVRVLGDIVRG
ncbi:MAG TPA: low molecular weight phosphatase family protein [Cellulomonas sp.]